MSGAAQLELPILVPLRGTAFPVRFPDAEDSMLRLAKDRFGLSTSDIIRRAVQLARLETARQGSPDFFLNPGWATFRHLRPKGAAGRKPRKQKISELQKSIVEHERAAASARRQLEQMEAREALVA